jgi:diguanylate cyclase (GGDEF)-like protein
MSDKRRKILACIMAGVLIVIIHFFIVDMRKRGTYDSAIELNNGWTLIFHGDTTELESTKDYVMTEKIVKGDTLILRRKLTDELPDNPVLRFKTYHSFVEAFRDGNRLYSNGESNYYADKIVGSGVHFVYLGAVAQIFKGNTLDLKFHLSENNAWNELPTFEILPANYAFGDFFARNSMSMMVGMFLMLFGVLALLLGVGAMFYGIKFFRILIIGVLAFCLGVWTLCYTKLIQLFSFNFAFNTILEYITLYIAPLALSLLLLHMHYGKIDKKRWWGLAIIAVLDVVLLVVASILNFTDIIHYPKTLWVFHTYAFLSLVYLLTAGILYKRNLDASTKILTVGITIFGAISVFDLLRYIVKTRFHLEHTPLDMSWLPLGTLIFVILLGLSYLVYMYYLFTEKTKKDILSVMAYRDSLTGLFNRAKCQQIFDVLDKSTSDFAIVSIDMNGLKLVNDRYGHNEGDQLIKSFATAFQEAFNGIGTSIRMGGDEFLAIVRNEHIEEVDATIAKMAELQKTYHAKLPIPLEAAYGIAYRHELLKDKETTPEESPNINAEKVYQLADERMYAMKSEMKSELVRR